MRFCFTNLIFNFVANSRASIGDCHFGPEWLFVGPTEKEERKSILQCSERGNEVHAPRQNEDRKRCSLWNASPGQQKGTRSNKEFRKIFTF